MSSRSPAFDKLLAIVRAWLVLCCAMTSSGCTGFYIPRIDPTGNRIFLPPDSPPSRELPGALPPAPGSIIAPPGLSLSPSQVVAPVGSEVIMIASVNGAEGFPLGREKVEWTLGPGSVGQIVTPGVRRPLEVLHWIHGLPKKVSDAYAINSTLTAPMTLYRTTPPGESVLVQTGQAWLTVMSPVEGTTQITALAPTIYGYSQRQQTATIYWVDAQWRFPAPAITEAGNRQKLVTTITRQTNHTPLAGWIVRYEITGGPEAGFVPDGAKSIDILTDAEGAAIAEIFQSQPMAGSNTITMQVLRPGDAASQGRPLPVGSGSTTQTWTSNQLSIRASGPSQAAAGATVTYRLEVTNPADRAATGVMVSDTPPPGLEFISSNPPAVPSTSGHDWRFEELGAHATTSIEVNYRASEGGSFDYCATVTSSEGQSSRSCVNTRAMAPQLEVTINGPQDSTVGSEVQFEILVTNRGATPATGIMVVDQFDAALQHATGDQRNRIEHDLVDLQPGGTARLAVNFLVMQPGQACQDVIVTANGGQRATARNCLNVGAAPAPQAPPEGPPTEGAPPATLPQEPKVSGNLALQLTRAGPDRPLVGELVRYSIELANRGNDPIQNIEVSDTFETSLQPAEATQGYEWLRGNTLGWKIGTLAPGATVRREIQFRCLRQTPRACHRVSVSSAGQQPVSDDACIEITVAAAAPPAGVPGLPPPPSPIKVTVADTADPINVGGDTTYQIVVTNTSGQSVYDVAVTATLSEQWRLEGYSGPSGGTPLPGMLRFAPIREFRGNENALSYELKVTGVRAGTGRVKVDVTVRGQTRPETAEHSTEILAPASDGG